MQLLQTIEDFCEADPLAFLVMAAIVLALLLAGLLLAIFWPLNRVRIDNDPMHHPFGDMPLLPRKWGEP